jgi:oligoendopeptidase F
VKDEVKDEVKYAVAKVKEDDSKVIREIIRAGSNGEVHRMTVGFYRELIALDDPSVLEGKLQALFAQEVHSAEDLEAWLKAESDLLEQVDEVMTGHAIEFECHNDNEEIQKRFEHDQEVISPLLKKYKSQLNQKFYDSPYRKELDTHKYEQLILRKVNAIELFREENLPLEVEVEKLVSKYSTIYGSLTVEWEGEEKTIPQMRKYLMSPNRETRESAWKLVQAKRLTVKAELDDIMDEMVRLRHQIAVNAGLENFRDYMFKVYERFDYTADDCKQFHESVRQHVVPLKDEIERRHQAELGVEKYRPWDETGVPVGKEPLHPFDQSEDLVEGVIRIYDRTDQEFADLLRALRDNHLLDLDSRKAKTPGGFNATLFATGLSFIFMNSAGSQDDVSTLLHEGGHAVHGHRSDVQPFMTYKNTPMESAEFASMGMELLTMDKWDEFYPDASDLARAQREQLEGIIKFLPWAMTVDAFQHWMYENPTHTADERHAKFLELAKSMSHHYTDWSGLEEELIARWQQQGHLFQVPFYYIEYAIAQLAAVQIWKAYTENSQAAVDGYKAALSLGSSKSLPEVYAAAGIRFDFSASMIQDLMAFTQDELAKVL